MGSRLSTARSNKADSSAQPPKSTTTTSDVSRAGEKRKRLSSEVEDQLKEPIKRRKKRAVMELISKPFEPRHQPPTNLSIYEQPLRTSVDQRLTIYSTYTPIPTPKLRTIDIANGPYDPDFGKKICEAYNKQVQRSWWYEPGDEEEMDGDFAPAITPPFEMANRQHRAWETERAVEAAKKRKEEWG
jgi:hypothetical protein